MQAQNQLCTTDGAMCCLGVLIDATVDGVWTLQEERTVHPGYRFRGDAAFPPPSVLHAAGLEVAEADELAKLNDKQGASFAEIADYIEAYL